MQTKNPVKVYEQKKKKVKNMLEVYSIDFSFIIDFNNINNIFLHLQNETLLKENVHTHTLHPFCYIIVICMQQKKFDFCC